MCVCVCVCVVGGGGLDVSGIPSSTPQLYCNIVASFPGFTHHDILASFPCRLHSTAVYHTIVASFPGFTHHNISASFPGSTPQLFITPLWPHSQVSLITTFQPHSQAPLHSCLSHHHFYKSHHCSLVETLQICMYADTCTSYSVDTKCDSPN